MVMITHDLFEERRAGRERFFLFRDPQTGIITESVISAEDALEQLRQALYMSDIQAAHECRWGAD